MGKTKKIVLFDIDYTIFNPLVFGELIREPLSKKLGITDVEHFKKIAKKADINSREQGYYHPTTYLKLLKEVAQSDVALSELEEVYYNEEIYRQALYEDAKSVLETLIKNNFEIGIFSKGHDPFQRLKVHALREHIVDDKIHIFTDKLEQLKNVLPLYKESDVYFVDDMIKVLEEAKRVDQHITTVLIKRPTRKEHQVITGKFKPDFVIDELKELLSIIVKK